MPTVDSDQFLPLDGPGVFAASYRSGQGGDAIPCRVQVMRSESSIELGPARTIKAEVQALFGADKVASPCKGDEFELSDGRVFLIVGEPVRGAVGQFWQAHLRIAESR
ncbi:MAG: hypothetical protein MI755_16320 [Sphingomonadales bacterium]|nr:hypothetical protein [Sphingomonadales bacterium]